MEPNERKNAKLHKHLVPNILSLKQKHEKKKPNVPKSKSWQRERALKPKGPLKNGKTET